MGRRSGVRVLFVVLMVAAVPGSSSPGYAADEPAGLIVALEGSCFDEAMISSDSMYFVCTGDHDSVSGRELYSVPIDGSAPATRLSPALFPTTDHVSWFDVTADGSTVVYAQGSTALSDVEFHRKVYSIPIAGGEPTSLSPAVMDGDLVWQPELSSDGSRVVYWWYNETDGGLHSVLTNGEGFVTIADPLEPNLIPMSTSISPDSSRVLYYTGFGSSLAANSVPLTGGDSVELSGPNPAGGTIVDGVITPDSSHYVYRADHDTAGITELYAVPLTGGSATKLNHSLETGESVGELVEIIPDSSGVLYSVLGGISPPPWYRVSITGGIPVEISQAIGPVHISPDSSAVVLDNAATTAYPLAGGPGVQLASRGSVVISPDSSVVWAWQNDDLDQVAQLFSVPLSGGDLEPHPGTNAPTTDHDGYLTPDSRMHVAPNSNRFVYAADTDGNGELELMMVSVHGGDPIELAANVFTWATHESDFSGLYVSPDSSRVVYWGDPFGTGAGVYSSLLTRYPESADVSWIVAENSATGPPIGVIGASDPDGDSLTFQVVTPGTLFDIDPETGEVTLNTPLDYETSAEHQFEVEISDGIVATSALVTIDVGNVNDNPPIADDLVVTVAEDAPLGIVIGTLGSDDADGDPITYSLIEPSSLFEVDGDGAVSLVGVLDYAIATEHLLIVEVSDGVFTDSATVTIIVTDVADPPPTTSTVPPTTTTTLPPPEFWDVPDTSLFHSDIVWLATAGITRGCNPPVNDEFCPDQYVTRGQMAAFLHRALADTLTPGSTVEFADDDDSAFEADIEWLAAVGITRGCNPPTNDLFCPNGHVTRGQMAAFLDRALDLAEPKESDLFDDDDDSMFETQIDRLATAGITKGCNPPDNTMFCPDGNVTRAQMAAFLHRALNEM